MVLTWIALLVVLAGAAGRWAAYRARVAPPRQFSPAQRGWWLPPLPAAGEFATGNARRLEIAGRVLVSAGAFTMLGAAAWSCYASATPLPPR